MLDIPDSLFSNDIALYAMVSNKHKTYRMNNLRRIKVYTGLNSDEKTKVFSCNFIFVIYVTFYFDWLWLFICLTLILKVIYPFLCHRKKSQNSIYNSSNNKGQYRNQWTLNLACCTNKNCVVCLHKDLVFCTCCLRDLLQQSSLFFVCFFKSSLYTINISVIRC